MDTGSGAGMGSLALAFAGGGGGGVGGGFGNAGYGEGLGGSRGAMAVVTLGASAGSEGASPEVKLCFRSAVFLGGSDLRERGPYRGRRRRTWWVRFVAVCRLIALREAK